MLFADAVWIQQFTEAGHRGVSRNCVRPRISRDHLPRFRSSDTNLAAWFCPSSGLKLLPNFGQYLFAK
jgi:hypothetical protein